MLRFRVKGFLGLRSARSGWCCFNRGNVAVQQLLVALGRSQISGLNREKDAEDGAARFARTLANAAAAGYATAVLVDDGLADPEAEAGAGVALGGEERLENVRACGCVHA